MFKAFVSEVYMSFGCIRDMQIKEDLAGFIGEFREGLVP